jgi:hypothetical protein
MAALENKELSVNWFPSAMVDILAPGITQLAQEQRLRGIVQDILLVSGPELDCVLFERMTELAYRRLEATNDVLSNARRVHLAPNVNMILGGTSISVMSGLEFPGVQTPELKYRMSALIKSAGVDTPKYVASRAALISGVNVLMEEIGKPVNLTLAGKPIRKSHDDNPQQL